MKTKLPNYIKTIDQAKAFLKELCQNQEVYHPEDNAHDIEWIALDKDQKKPTVKECDQLNKLMADIYALPGNQNSQNMAFDPCQYILDLINNDENLQ